MPFAVVLAYASIEQVLFAARWSRCAQLCNIAKVDMSSTIRFHGPGRVNGTIVMPGDKSISHRAAMLASIADGDSIIDGFASSADCASTLDCIKRLGVPVEAIGTSLIIHGQRSGRYEPSGDSVLLDAGNSGSTIRMMSGLVAPQSFEVVFDGDASLRRRPMRRIIEPLRLMGAAVEAERDNFPPLRIKGRRLRGIDYRSSISSAQVKTAVLFAGLRAEGSTSYHEPALSRNHTEFMLREFGIEFEETSAGGSHEIRLEGGQDIQPLRYRVPGDPSSAAFFAAAAAALSDSNVVIKQLNLNPTRIAFIEALESLGGGVAFLNKAHLHGEAVGDLAVSSRSLSAGAGVWRVAGDAIPILIDELPMLAVLSTQVEGRVEVREANELRIKESDRISAVVAGVRALGGEIEEFEDGFAVNGPQRLTGGVIDSEGDHRIAMAFSIAGLMAHGVTEIRGAECAAVSFPEFYEMLMSLTPEGLIEEVHA